MHDLNTWRTIALGAVALGQSCFVALYVTFPWYKSFLGRALFYKALMLAVITDTFIFLRVLDLGRSDLTFLILYLLLAVGVWWQFIAFLKVRTSGRQHDARAGDDR